MENLVNMIRLSKSCIGEEEKLAVMKVLDEGFLGMGSEVQKFEAELEVFFGRKVVCVTNGTAALQLSLQAISVGLGDEVLVPSLTYLASFQAISATGALPVACEVLKDSLTIDWRDAETRITSKTKAIMPVHYAGGVGPLGEVYAFARAHGLRVIEDAAHAFGSTYHRKKIGSFGDIACFSFDGIKNITSGEGGCIVSEDLELIQKVQDARLLGVEKDTESRYLGLRSWDFDVFDQGWRYHMSNVMAAIGRVQLQKFPKFSERRQELARYYDTKFNDHTLIKNLNLNYDEVVPHIYMVQIQGLKNRKLLQKKLMDAGIQTGVHYLPNHLLSFYKNKRAAFLPLTEKIYSEILTLPLHPEVSFRDIDYIANTLIQAASEDCI